MYGKKFSAQFKLLTFEEYLKARDETGMSIVQFTSDKGISDSIFNDWVVKYRRQLGVFISQ